MRASVSSDRSAQDRGFAHLTAPNSKALIKDTLKDRSAMSPIIRLLGPGDASVLDNVAPSVFDNAIDPRWTAEFGV